MRPNAFQIAYFLSLLHLPVGFLIHQRYDAVWSRHQILVSAANEANAIEKNTFVLPIFPLRKTVKLPTEPLTLNLYEQRYLDLAEYVLQQKDDERCFGALFSSDKAQMIKAGTGPIVPLIEPGDIGVTFLVEHDEEAMIPTLGAAPRRRIRLVGTGGIRFRINKILHDGCGGGCAPSAGEKPLPFLLVEASLIHDIGTPLKGDDQEFDDLLSRLSSQVRQAHSSQPIIRDEEEDASSFEYQLENAPEELVGRLRTKVPPGLSKENLETEFLSFLIASKLLADGDSFQRLDTLRVQSTIERLRLLDASLTKGWLFRR